MIPETIYDIGEKKNGSSIQARNSGATGFDMPVTPVSPFQLFTIGMMGMQTDGIPAWSYFPQIRDMYLRLMSKKEPIMAGALYSVISRVKSLPWHIKGGKINKEYYQKLFAEADGGLGYGQFIAKVVSDLLTQDNGAFIELVGAGRPDKPLMGRVKEIWHLDSAQCWRTFDPEFPVIYTNPLDNSYHRLHQSRVIMLSSNPQPDERGRNVGFCAVSRALKMMQLIRNIQTYKDEKISGKFKRGFIYGGPLTPKQFKQATDASEANAENSNFMVYNEVPVLLSTVADVKLNLMDLASLPDGFDYKTEIDTYVYILALCFGTDAREFWPATSSGATKADASVQHLKAQGKGIGDIVKMLETAFNWKVSPLNGSAEFEYDETDDEQDKAVAEVHQLKATNIALYQTNGWINAQEGRALAIAQGLIDPKQLQSTDDSEVADDSAPMDDETINPDQTLPPTTESTVPPPQVGQASIRAAKKVIPIDDHTIKYQRKLERLMSGFIDKVVAAPGTLDSAADDLYGDFVDLLPGELTDAFGIGLAGEDPTDSGIARVKTVAETSKDYFKTSFLPALTAVSLAGLAAEDIRAALSPFVDRIGLYAGSFWTSIWEGQRDATPTAYRVRRVLQQGAQHCATCPGKEGTYDSYDDMIAQCGGLPGDGSDDCMSNCRCTLQTEDGDGGFSPLVGEPTVFTQPLFEVLR